MDFNILHPTEPRYQPKPITIDPVSLFRNEILMLLETKPTDILGEYENFLDIQALVFTPNTDEEEINSKLRMAIELKSAYASDFHWDSSVYFMRDDASDSEIGVIDIQIYSMVDPAKVADTIKFLYQL